MKRLWNWKQILVKAWSIRLMFLAAMMSGIEVILPFYYDAFPRGVFAVLSFAAVAGAFVARLMAQRNLE